MTHSCPASPPGGGRAHEQDPGSGVGRGTLGRGQGLCLGPAPRTPLGAAHTRGGSAKRVANAVQLRAPKGPPAVAAGRLRPPAQSPPSHGQRPRPQAPTPSLPFGVWRPGRPRGWGAGHRTPFQGDGSPVRCDGLCREGGRVQGSEGCGGRRARGPRHLQGRGAGQRDTATRRSSSQDGPPRTAMQGGSLFCPRNTELVPTGPVPPSVCPAPGGSPATALRPHARPQLRRRLRHGGCGGAGGVSRAP